VVEKKLLVPFQKSALVVEKKNPLSTLERSPVVVVAITFPLASVSRSDDGRDVMAKDVVVALVVVARVAMMLVNVEFAVVEVAVKLGAVTVLYAVSVPLRRVLPSTSNMVPVVDVAFVPRSVT
jgi:hypothetical protein